MNNTYKCILPLYFIFTSTATSANNPPLQHSISHKDAMFSQQNIGKYFISEKLDGMRGYWTGNKLVSRRGNTIHSPVWFTENWPSVPLDGELWIARANFQQLISCVKRRESNKPVHSSCWSKVRFMIFDLPNSKEQFKARVIEMRRLQELTKSPYLQAIKQFKVNSLEQLDDKLTQVTSQQGEGLMLHLDSAYYHVGRSASLVKLKRHQDGEAIVIAHIEGKGKYQGKLGSLLVETSKGKRFKIGTGFSDKERELPPEIGSTISFKYNGMTQNGTPRFARYWRVRAVRN